MSLAFLQPLDLQDVGGELHPRIPFRWPQPFCSYFPHFHFLPFKNQLLEEPEIWSKCVFSHFFSHLFRCQNCCDHKKCLLFLMTDRKMSRAQKNANDKWSLSKMDDTQLVFVLTQSSLFTTVLEKDLRNRRAKRMERKTNLKIGS